MDTAPCADVPLTEAGYTEKSPQQGYWPLTFFYKILKPHERLLFDLNCSLEAKIYPFRRLLTISLTNLLSAAPFVAAITAFITPPISFMELAPLSALLVSQSHEPFLPQVDQEDNLE